MLGLRAHRAGFRAPNEEQPSMGSALQNYFADTRHTTSPTSSATSSAPSASIAMPTGAPIRVFSSFEAKPLTTVCGRPVGLPS